MPNVYEGHLLGEGLSFGIVVSRFNSFVTDKPIPEDFDACWDPQGVDRSKLDPVFSQFSNKRAAQKQKFGGEFFLSTTRADAQGRTFIDFFQIEKYTVESKGIVLINLSTDPVLQQQVTP